MATYSQAPALLPRPAAAPTAARSARHLLAVGDDVDPAEVEALALSRFQATAWVTEPAETRTRQGAQLTPGVLRTSRHTTLSGPYAPVALDADAAWFEHPVDMIYEIICPRERGDAPFQGGGDRDGLARVFAEAMPIREEWRVVQWLIASARRLGGSVRFDVGDGTQQCVTPNPDVAVDVTVYSDVWLAPDAALAVCRSAVPGARLASAGEPWAGPAPTIGRVPVLDNSPLTAEQLTALHERADDADIAALSAPRTLDAYAIEVDLGADGLVSVEVVGVDTLPVVLRGLEWAHNGAVAYLARWTPEDLVDWQREFPSAELENARGRAADVVTALVRVIFAAVGGEVADQDDFLLEPEDV